MDLPRSIRMSTSGSSRRSSKRVNGTKTSMPAATSAHGHHAPGPLSRMKVRPEVISRSPTASSAKPRVSTRPPLRPVDSGTPKRMANQQAVTATAGTISTSCSWPARASTRAPAARAPAITPNSSAPTRSPAARRVRAAPSGSWCTRLKIRAISSGSQTT